MAKKKEVCSLLIRPFPAELKRKLKLRTASLGITLREYIIKELELSLVLTLKKLATLEALLEKGGG